MRRLRRAATSATAIAPDPVPTSATRSGGAPAGRGAAVSRVDHGGDRLVHEQLGLGPRDERARVGGDGLAVELAEAADVGHGLAALPAGDVPLERGGGPIRDRRVRVRQHADPVDAQRKPHQQLGVQPRGVDAGGGEALGGVADQPETVEAASGMPM